MKLKSLISFYSWIYWLKWQAVKVKSFLIKKTYGVEGLSMFVERLPKTFVIPVLKMYGAKIGTNCDMERGLVLHRIDKKTKKDPFKKLFIGNRVYIGHNMIIDLTEEVKIGNDCAFGANCQIWTHTGDWTINRDDEKDKQGPVLIGDAVICYSAVIISQGISIGNYARIGAGSVVLSNIENNTFNAGIPAKFIKHRKYS
jgi:acetyltransferase-like isoleucine patch superfamily enzyme